MLQRIQEEKKHVVENCSNNAHEVHVELDSHIKKKTINNSGSYSSEDQQHDNIALGRPKHIIRPSIRYSFEDMVFYTLVTSNRDSTTFQKALHNEDKSKYMGI